MHLQQGHFKDACVLCMMRHFYASYLMVVVAGAAFAGSAAAFSVTPAAAAVGSALFAGVPAGVPLFVGDPFYVCHVGFTAPYI